MFQRARLKLTAWYLIIIMCISTSFSVIIYRGLVHEVERLSRSQHFRFERYLLDRQYVPMPPPVLTDPELIDDVKRRILFMLLIINGGILIISGGLGYMLAGITLKPIADMVAEQNRFISDASHELRTPLTSLKTAFEVYLRQSRSKAGEAHTLISESVAEVNKLQSLSDSLLQLAQYQKPGVRHSFATVPLGDVIRDAIRRTEPLAASKKISIQNNMKSIRVHGNKDSLIDLFVILLDNAIKYSHGEKKVTVESKKTDDTAVISVKDQGIGISEKDLPHIFDRFYRADTARSKIKADGYGLGLSIAKTIVDTHGGAITVTSTPGKGSTFTVRLPAAFS